MSSIEREVALEALSALLQTPVKDYGGINGKSIELNIFNFVVIALSKLADDLAYASLLQGFKSDVFEEMFVDMDEFFDQRFDYDFTHLQDDSICMRGNEPYKRPCGWYRFALRVKNKYPDGNTWLGTDGWRSHSVAGEWPVSYHGTTVERAAGIVKSHYRAGNDKDRQLYGRGIYSTYDIEQASGYSREFTSKTNDKKYRVIMQNRINPQKRTVCSRSDYWLIEIPEGTPYMKEKEIVEESIRPYGILIKEV